MVFAWRFVLIRLRLPLREHQPRLLDTGQFQIKKQRY